MNKVVYKYGPLFVCEQQILLPIDKKILHVGEEQDQIYFWAEVDLFNPTETRTFTIIGTGWAVPPDHDYRGTVVLQSGFVWHLYERIV
jgi:hypothetical protein